jgi:hypothetical protein
MRKPIRLIRPIRPIRGKLGQFHDIGIGRAQGPAPAVTIKQCHLCDCRIARWHQWSAGVQYMPSDFRWIGHVSGNGGCDHSVVVRSIFASATGDPKVGLFYNDDHVEHRNSATRSLRIRFSCLMDPWFLQELETIQFFLEFVKLGKFPQHCVRLLHSLDFLCRLDLV